jgi:hypothetical protein
VKFMTLQYEKCHTGEKRPMVALQITWYSEFLSIGVEKELGGHLRF